MNSNAENGLIRLVRLMTDPEKAVLRADLGMPADVDDEALLAAIARLPKYEAVRAFLRAADATNPASAGVRNNGPIANCRPHNRLHFYSLGPGGYLEANRARVLGSTGRCCVQVVIS
jgi:hypothetical protein